MEQKIITESQTTNNETEKYVFNFDVRELLDLIGHSQQQAYIQPVYELEERINYRESILD